MKCSECNKYDCNTNCTCECHDLRKLIAMVLTTKGCSCCERSNHKELMDKLAVKLDIPKFDDDSGYNWWEIAGK